MNKNNLSENVYFVDIHSHDCNLEYHDSCTNVYLFWDKNDATNFIHNEIMKKLMKK